MQYIDPEKRYGAVLWSLAFPLRKASLILDADPSLSRNYQDLPAVDFFAADMFRSPIARVKSMEAFAYADVGALLALPGSSLSGVAIKALGSIEIVEAFYQKIKYKKHRTFFAISEEKKGSDASNIHTRLEKIENKHFLSGKKCFVGNGAVAEMGLVLVKTDNHPLGMCFVYLDSALLKGRAVKRESMNMFGLKGAQIACLCFDALPIPTKNILGTHLKPSQRGLLAIIHVFNQFRVAVGAMAIGLSQAVLDHVFLNYHSADKKFLSRLSVELSAARQLLHKLTLGVEVSNQEAEISVSLGKLNAVRISEKIVSDCLEILSFRELMQDPWLLKAYRDIYCFEYMEGTSNIHRNVIKKNIGLVNYA